MVVAQFLPRHFFQLVFELIPAGARSADQIGNGRIALAHVLQGGFGGNAPVHDPNALGLAILRLDFFQK